MGLYLVGLAVNSSLVGEVDSQLSKTQVNGYIGDEGMEVRLPNSAGISFMSSFDHETFPP